MVLTKTKTHACFVLLKYLATSAVPFIPGGHAPKVWNRTHSGLKPTHLTFFAIRISLLKALEFPCRMASVVSRLIINKTECILREHPLEMTSFPYLSCLTWHQYLLPLAAVPSMWRLLKRVWWPPSDSDMDISHQAVYSFHR